MKLGVNIDHIAVLREARLVNDPDIIYALYEAIIAGADQITIHLREDRRHINDDDVFDIISHSKIPVNLECSVDEDIIQIVKKLRPNRATLVPERREELTTEGGLNLHLSGVKKAIDELKEEGIDVSLFVDPNPSDMALCAKLGADMVELHTGAYANAFLMLNSNLNLTKYAINSLKLSRLRLAQILEHEISRVHCSAQNAAKIGISVAAGHGLNYQNVKAIAAISEIGELNIGQSIVARAVFVGLKDAIKEMISCIK